MNNVKEYVNDTSRRGKAAKLMMDRRHERLLATITCMRMDVGGRLELRGRNGDGPSCLWDSALAPQGSGL